jgi:hypothetical protein
MVLGVHDKHQGIYSALRTNNCTGSTALIQSSLPWSSDLIALFGAIVVSKLFLKFGVGKEIAYKNGIVASNGEYSETQPDLNRLYIRS